MTQKEFESRSKSLLADFARAVKRMKEAEARQHYREEHQLIYVRRHVVEAYFRRVKSRG